MANARNNFTAIRKLRNLRSSEVSEARQFPDWCHRNVVFAKQDEAKVQVDGDRFLASRRPASQSGMSSVAS